MKRTIKEVERIIISEISDDIAEDMKRRDLYDLLLPVIKKHNGKKVTRRIDTAFKAVLPQNTLTSYSAEYGMYHIYVWGKGVELEYEDRVSFLLGYHGLRESTPITVDEFAKHNACNGPAASERIADLEKILVNLIRIRAMAEAEVALSACEDTYKSLFDTPDAHARYGIERALGRRQ